MVFNAEAFPNLNDANHRKIGDRSDQYNCIAWAAGRRDQWWEAQDDPLPGRVYYWPENAPPDDRVTSLIVAFESIGYSICDDGSLVDGVEKIAIYARAGREVYEHAARQLENGKWTSKMGELEVIEHDAPGGRERPGVWARREIHAAQTPASNSKWLRHDMIRSKLNRGERPQVAAPIDPLPRQFLRLKAQWLKETMVLSDPGKITSHPAFLAIVAMGESAVPFILHELESGPSLLVWALPKILGKNPVPPDSDGEIDQLTEAWLQWGRARRAWCDRAGSRAPGGRRRRAVADVEGGRRIAGSGRMTAIYEKSPKRLDHAWGWLEPAV